MQFLEETKSADGTAVAKIYKDGDDGFLVEKTIEGVSRGTVPLTASLAEVRQYARDWVSSVSLLNG